MHKYKPLKYKIILVYKHTKKLEVSQWMSGQRKHQIQDVVALPEIFYLIPLL